MSLSQIYLIWDTFIYLDEFLYGKQVSKQNIYLILKELYSINKKYDKLNDFFKWSIFFININKTKILNKNDEFKRL